MAIIIEWHLKIIIIITLNGKVEVKTLNILSLNVTIPFIRQIKLVDW